ncbi:MAG: hypothetical protein QOK11_556 [Pseudonocardiales bacterium]|nr:hypothetical protein [Pseudonocardiales bacterium]
MTARQRSGSGALRRAGLNREKVLTTAIAIADEGGTESLSMRKLAKELGVEAMSLYNHIAHKSDLLDAMIDVVFGEIEFPTDHGDWRAAIRQRAISTREALNRHRWANGLMESRLTPGPANMRLHDAAMGCLREGGFSIVNAIHAYSLLDAYVYGFALQEKTLPYEGAEEIAAHAQAQMAQFQAQLAHYPYLREVVGGYVAEGNFDFGDEFLFGLDIILDGLERLRGVG